MFFISPDLDHIHKIQYPRNDSLDAIDEPAHPKGKPGHVIELIGLNQLTRLHKEFGNFNKIVSWRVNAF